MSVSPPLFPTSPNKIANQKEPLHFRKSVCKILGDLLAELATRVSACILALSYTVFCLACSPINLLFRILNALTARKLECINFVVDKTKEKTKAIFRGLLLAPLLLFSDYSSHLVATTNMPESDTLFSDFKSSSNTILNQAIAASKKEHFFPKHLLARALFLTHMVVALITGLARVTIGLVLAPYALFFWGHFYKINDAAINGLEGVGFLEEILDSLGKFINPNPKI